MRKKHFYLFSIVSICIMWFWASDAVAQSKRYYVRAGASSSNTAGGATGSWSNACDTLQAVINVASAGDTVFVAAGIYKGGFFMKEGVQVYGGFKSDGSEIEYADRTNPVDISGANLAGCSVLDGCDSVRVLTQLTPFSAETVWDGFVIRNGSATGGKGGIVFNASGTAPAGIIYRWDATTHSGYMVGLDEVQKEWGGYGTDIPDLPDISLEADARNDFSGSGKTALTVRTLSAGNYSAYWCDTLTTGGFSDWYLPACGELLEIHNQMDSVNAAISQIKDVATVTLPIPLLSADRYWSGSESNMNGSWSVYINYGNMELSSKNNSYKARAVHALNLFVHSGNLTFSGGGALLQEQGVLRRCVVTGNKAPGMGGGIYTRGGSVEGCLVTGNRAGRGSGVYAAEASVLTSSTVAYNMQDTSTIAPRMPPSIGDYYYTDDSYSPSAGSATPLSDRELAGIVCLNLSEPDPYIGSLLDTVQALKDWTEANYVWASSLRTGGYKDWHVPNTNLLIRMFIYRPILNSALSQIGGTPLITSGFYWADYWYLYEYGWAINYSNNRSYTLPKTEVHSVRAVRTFNLSVTFHDQDNAGVVAATGVKVENSILWGNEERGGNAADYYGVTGNASYSCIGEGVTGGTGNIHSDPEFIGSGNYRLQSGSPALKTANPALAPAALTIDLDNRRRIASTKIDMGAYQSLSNDTTLAYVRVNGIDAVYDPAEKTYAITLPYGVDSAFIRATAADSVYIASPVEVLISSQDVNNDTVYLFAGDNMYEIVVTAEDGSTGTYQLIIRRSCIPISISAQPAGDTILLPAKHTLSVSASGDSPEYQWYQKDVGLITDSVNHTFTPNVSGYYFAGVKNDCTPEFYSDTVHVLFVQPVRLVNDLPAEENLCDQDSHTLRVITAGSVSDHTWYKDGVVVSGATTDTLDITEPGMYQVRVNGMLDTLYSTEATVTFSYSPTLVTDLRDMTVSSVPVTIEIEAAGEGLTYQWYYNERIITGAVSESIRIREGGTYHVVVSNPCGTVESHHANIEVSFVTPEINRKVEMPQVEGVYTSPSAGTHYVKSYSSFVFEMWAADGYSLDHVNVSTDRDNYVVIEPTGDDGRVRVTVKYIYTAVQIRIEGVSPVGNPQIGSDTRVWNHSGRLYIRLSSAQEISVYTPTGNLYDRRRLPAGDSSLPMPAGIYFIRLSGGEVCKVIIRN